MSAANTSVTSVGYQPKKVSKTQKGRVTTFDQRLSAERKDELGYRERLDVRHEGGLNESQS